MLHRVEKQFPEGNHRQLGVYIARILDMPTVVLLKSICLAASHPLFAGLSVKSAFIKPNQIVMLMHENW
jgi:hypothetical protein